MRSIRQLREDDLDVYISIFANAYPAFKLSSQEDRERFRQRLLRAIEDPTVHSYGLFEADKLLGVMTFYDFNMKLLSTKTLVGGVGGVAVDLLHKKEKVARDMIDYFLHYYRQKGACLTVLYPFRPDFYKRMGFGYGTKMNQYRIKPDSLPRGSAREHITFLGTDDKEAVRACYQRICERTNGLIDKTDRELDALFDNVGVKVVGYKQDGEILGYIVFTFQPAKAENFLSNNLVIREFIYETSQVLGELLAFLNTQADQVERIILNTQDESFHHLLHDPRNGTNNILPSVFHESNVQGVGVMYRVIDVPRLFDVLSTHSFGGQSCRLKLSLSDSFLPANEGEFVIYFEAGVPRLQQRGDYEVAIRMDIAEFSSLITGVIGFRQLWLYGMADISDTAYIETVHRLFFTEQKPWCTTPF